MDITGFDNVVFTTKDPRLVVSAVVKQVRTRWPNAIVTKEFNSGEFEGNDCLDRNSLPEESGELYFCRDRAMDAFWQENGYDVMPDGEGPFAILYRTRTEVAFALGSVHEPNTSNEGIGPPDDYPAMLCCPRIYELTAVTPDDPAVDAFSRRVFEMLCHHSREMPTSGE